MKKYEAPILEFIQVEQISYLAAGSPEQGDDADAKLFNNIVFEEIVEEPDTTSIWDDPWQIKYSLWEDE